MNIGIDMRCLMSPARTGVAEYTFGLVSSLLKLDNYNQYFLFYNSHEDTTANLPKFTQQNAHYIGYKWPNKLFNASTKLFKKPKIDKIIKEKSLSTLDWFFSPNLNFTAISKNTKFALTIHDLSFQFFPEFFNAKQRLWHQLTNPKKQCERANLILTPSNNTKGDIADAYKIPPEKIKVIYPGNSIVSPQRLSFAINLPNKYILFLGTLEDRKNVLGLIEAFELVSNQFPDYNLVIAGGNGYGAQKIFNFIARSKVKDKIKILGYIKDDHKAALYKKASIFIYPSFYEGFGFPVVEAMSVGTPVVCSHRSSLPEIAEKAAYYIDPNNIASMARGINSLLTDDKLRQFYINEGYVQAQKFNWDKSAKCFLDTLQ